MPAEPVAGVRGGPLHPGDPLTREWTVALVSPQACGALTAFRPDGPGDVYDYVLTHDRDRTAAAAAALMARIGG